jgi:hypothetical protein
MRVIYRVSLGVALWFYRMRGLRPLKYGTVEIAVGIAAILLFLVDVHIGSRFQQLDRGLGLVTAGGAANAAGSRSESGDDETSRGSAATQRALGAAYLEHVDQRADPEAHGGPHRNTEHDAAEPAPAWETPSRSVPVLRLEAGRS